MTWRRLEYRSFITIEITTTHDPVHVDCHSVLTGLVIWEVCAYATDLNPLTNDGGGGWLWPGNNPNSDDDNGSDNEKLKDPCENIRNMESNMELTELLESYMRRAKEEPIEYSYTKTTNGEEKRKEGVAGHVDIELRSGKQYTTIIHTHDYTEGDDLNAFFSPNDLFLLYDALKNGHIKDIDNFYFVLAAGEGTYVSLHISDPTKFLAFGEAFANKQERLYRHIIDATSDVSSKELRTALYVQLLNSLDSGLTYMQAEAVSNPTWSIVNAPNSQGQLTTFRCN